MIAGFLQPLFRNRLDPAEHAGKFFALKNRRGDREPDDAIRGLNADALKVHVLRSILLGSAELPLTRMAVANVLRVVRLLSANLTYLGHDGTPGCQTPLAAFYNTRIAPILVKGWAQSLAIGNLPTAGLGHTLKPRRHG